MEQSAYRAQDVNGVSQEDDVDALLKKSSVEAGYCLVMCSRYNTFVELGPIITSRTYADGMNMKEELKKKANDTYNETIENKVKNIIMLGTPSTCVLASANGEVPLFSFIRSVYFCEPRHFRRCSARQGPCLDRGERRQGCG